MSRGSPHTSRKIQFLCDQISELTTLLHHHQPLHPAPQPTPLARAAPAVHVGGPGPGGVDGNSPEAILGPASGPPLGGIGGQVPHGSPSGGTVEAAEDQDPGVEEPQWLGDFDVELAEAENPFAADDRLGPGALQPVQDLVTGTVATSPWQFGQYDRRSSTWLSAAQRRHQHRRRSNALLGVASVDLSGPHEASPMPGMRTSEHKAHYFLVLTVRADLSVGYADSAVQTESNPDSDSQPADPMIAGSSESAPRSPLIYVALVHKKSDAAHAVMALIAQAQDEHGHMPQKLIFRLHSDKGQEFCAHSLEKFCAAHGIHKTTTQGYDPSSNGAGESAVGYIKRKARQLLTGARMPSSWRGMASLTAAHYSRCAAGLLRFPTLPFGTRAMMVSDPAPTKRLPT